MPEWVLLVTAIAALGKSWIDSWKMQAVVQQTLMKASVIEGHVNSKETKYVEQIAGLERERDILRKLITDKDATAALLAQAAATVIHAIPPVPVPVLVTNQNQPSLSAPSPAPDPIEVVVTNEPDSPVPTIAQKK